MKGGERLYLLHVRDEIRKVLGYTCGGRDAFFAQTLIQDAVLRNITVIGEAVKNLGQDLEDLIGRKVDVVSEGGISPYLEPYILAEATPL